MEKDATATMKAKLKKQQKNVAISNQKVKEKLLAFRGYEQKKQKKVIVKATTLSEINALSLVDRMNKLTYEMRLLNARMKKRI
jgi:peptidyl-tRNA hydrolase